MSWLDLVQDATFLRTLFPEGGPSLARVHVHEVVFHRDGPSLALRLDLPDWPNAPPPQWAGANTVQVRLVAIALTHVRIEGWSADPVGPFSLAPYGDGVEIRFAGSGTDLVARARWIRVDAVRAYVDAARSE